MYTASILHEQGKCQLECPLVISHAQCGTHLWHISQVISHYDGITPW